MSKELDKTEEEIVEVLGKKTSYFRPAIYVKEVEDELLDARVLQLEKKRQFDLERIQRRWYNQGWFHILATAILSILATVVGALVISKIH